MKKMFWFCYTNSVVWNEWKTSGIKTQIMCWIGWIAYTRQYDLNIELCDGKNRKHDLNKFIATNKLFFFLIFIIYLIAFKEKKILQFGNRCSKIKLNIFFRIYNFSKSIFIIFLGLRSIMETHFTGCFHFQ